MLELDVIEAIEGKYKEMREIMWEEYRMLGRIAKQVDNVEDALDVTSAMDHIARGLLSDDISYRSMFLGNYGGGGG